MGVGPPPSDKGSVPTQDRLGRDEERHPALPVDEACERGDECPVRPGEAGSCDLAAKDQHLVTHHQDLGVLGDGVHAVHRQDLDDATNKTVEEAERHGSARSLLGSFLVKLGIALFPRSGGLPGGPR